MIGGEFDGDGSTGRQQFASASDVDDRMDGAVEIPLHRHVTVGHGVLGGDHTVVARLCRRRRHATGRHRQHEGGLTRRELLGGSVASRRIGADDDAGPVA